MNKNFLMMYCIYDPDNYLGHKMKRIVAKNAAEAEKQAHAILESFCGKTRWEYSIVEVTASTIGPKIHDTRTKK